MSPGYALPEYPRPRLSRRLWHNLNGLWQYAGAGDESPPFGQDLPERILVPYPPESALSGIQRHDDRMWYRRLFRVPDSWPDGRVLLHFGAVDQHAVVWLNGTLVADHTGGYAAFHTDITDALRPGAEQELVVGVRDENEHGDCPVGKQRARPRGIFYTGSSGIWRTVWLEPVPTAYISDLRVVPDVAAATLWVDARTVGTDDHHLLVTVREPDTGRVAGQHAGARTIDAHQLIPVAIPDAHLWNPADPYLYDLEVRLLDAADELVDRVGGYAGMRSISLLADAAGRQRIALNGTIGFQPGLLDQGYWPDGGYTAPTDEALRFDIERAKALGFTMIRKHMKVEPERWYYWADRLGMLVWQDMPSPGFDQDAAIGTDISPNPTARTNYLTGLDELVDQLGHFPSIVVWTLFNEGWGEFDTDEVTHRAIERDPTRLVTANSGVNCCYSLPDTRAGHLYDDHTYPGPGKPEVDDDRARVDGEYGGIGFTVDGHVWPVGEPHGYAEPAISQEELTDRYHRLSADLALSIVRDGVAAAVYTQATDVEAEVNGLWTYDRRVLKVDPRRVRADNQTLIDLGSGDPAGHPRTR